MRNLRFIHLILALFAAAGVAGCGDDDGGNVSPPPPDGSTGECEDGADGVVDETDTTITVRDQITCPVTWTADKDVLLDGLVFVYEGGSLTIEPGTRIFGLTNSTSGLPSALIVSRKAKIDAQGTAAAPIVFSSSNPPGERASSDWGGVVLLGRGFTNKGRNDESDDYLVKNIEGIDPDDDRGIYGGDDPSHDCGILRYARIEFASAELSPDNELNGLTVAGCGSETTLEYIQVHRADDDGIEFFGGSANISYAVVSGMADDGLDWDESWDGNADHFIVHKFLAIGDNGIEADNNGGSHDAQPRSNPRVEHMTLIGQGDSRAMLLRVGTAGRLSHFLVAGWDINAEIRDEATANLWSSPDGNGDELVIRNSIFHEDGTFNTNVTGFELADEIIVAALNNVTDSTVSVTSDSATAPNYAPNGDVDTGVASSLGLTYAGAIDPDGDDWTVGWTDYPPN